VRPDVAACPSPVLDHRFSSAWFDPAHNGEGFVVEVLGNDRAVVIWFTNQDDGSQRWMLGVGEIKGDRIVISDLMDIRGGRFGADFDPDDVVMKTVGSLTVSFPDCSTALFNYSVDNNSHHQATTRLTQVHGHGCGSEIPVADGGISGSWFDPSHNGEGFVIEQLTADQAMVVWFTYDETGKQTWLLNAGTIDNGTITVPQLQRPVGGRFGRSFDPDSVTRETWGELSLDLDCSGGTASYTTTVEGFSNGSQTLVPLTRLLDSACSN